MYNNKEFTKIKDISERRRLPLLGKIRLGIKKLSAKQVEYPSETDYFVCPPEITSAKDKDNNLIYGEHPKELDVMIPVEDESVIFPQAYRHYGSTRGLKCIGNGENAMKWSDDKKTLERIQCPCEKLEQRQCSKSAYLMVMLPKVSMSGIYQIHTGSINSIVDINSGIDYVRALIGRVSMIPLKLKRVPIETHNEGKKQTHFTLKLFFDGSVDFINQLRENTRKVLLQQETIALPAPKDDGPGEDPVDVVDGITDEEPIETLNHTKQSEVPLNQIDPINTTQDTGTSEQQDTPPPKTDKKGRIIKLSELKKKHPAEIVRMIRDMATEKNIAEMGIQAYAFKVAPKTYDLKWTELKQEKLIDLFKLLAKEESHEKVGF